MDKYYGFFLIGIYTKITTYIITITLQEQHSSFEEINNHLNLINSSRNYTHIVSSFIVNNTEVETNLIFCSIQNICLKIMLIT